MVLEPSTFTVSSALSDALTMVRERATAHAIRHHGGPSPTISAQSIADHLRFKQVLLNLLFQRGEVHP